MKDLRGKTAVITGAASGIGRALALTLAREGCALALADINTDGLDETAAQARAAGATVSTHRVDVSDQAQMAALPAAVIAEHGAAHLLINNAGVTILKSFLDHEIRDLEWIMGINLWGVIYGCRFFLPHMLTLDEAHIVNLSSIFGIIGVPGQSSYSTTKFAVRGLSEALAEELHGHTSVRVSVVHPGGVNTRITADARSDDADMLGQLQQAFAHKAISADEAAAQIIAGVKRNRQRILVAREAPMMDLLKRLMPVRGNHLVVRMITRVLGLDQDAIIASTFQRGDGGSD